MIEHPVPQNITSYEFRLIGNMTIKQFLLLLAGGGLGFLAYSTNLPAIIKWPLAVIGVVSGVGMAFVPYEERSLDQWFVNFIKAIYRPTKYYWRRVPKPPAFFTYQAVPSAMLDAQKPDLTPYRQTQVKQFLSSLSGVAAAEPADPLDMLGKGGGLDALFSQVQAASNVEPAGHEIVSKPSLQTRPRPLGAEKKAGTVFTTPPASAPLPLVPQETIAPPAPIIPASVPTTPAAPPEKKAPTPVLLTPSQTSLTVEPEKPKAAVASPKRGEAEVAQLQTVSVGRSAKNEPEPAPAITPAAELGAYLTPGVAPRTAHMETVVPAVFDKTLPFPSTAEKPNILIGMVHSAAKSIAPGAIVEIVDGEGNTVRAMKTNTLGQFYMSSPLKNGTYTIHTEKEGLAFPVYQFDANGSVLDPVDITATA